MLIASAALASAAVPSIGDNTWRDIDFAPCGWKLYDKEVGDLDGDGRMDSVLIFQENDPAKMMGNTGGLGMDYYDANSRVVIFAS